MRNFDFSKEMIIGKKHMKKLEYNPDDYKFTKIVTDLFEIELNNLHTKAENTYELFTTVGKDSNTEFHKCFYKYLNDNGNEIKEEYTKFINNVVLPFLDLEEVLVQKFPSFRVQLPNNLAVVINHYDSDNIHQHPTGEINFIHALTDMYDTNTVYVEKMPLLDEYEPILLKAGETICFNGNKCKHHNKINNTGKTRVSWDFRVLPLNYYKEDNIGRTASTNKKYIENSYYQRYTLNKVKPYIARDIWDKEKENFNHIMKKYKVNDAWGVVDIFEKTIAAYAGSKYAVSIDNCTNGLFL